MSRTTTVTLLLTLYPAMAGEVVWPGVDCANVGEIDTSEVWMSAGGTPSALTSEPSALAAFAFAAIASPAFLPVLVTPTVTRAKSGAAVTLPSPLTSTQRSLLISIKRSSARAGDTAASAVRNAIRNELGRMVPPAGASLRQCGRLRRLQVRHAALRLLRRVGAIAEVAMARAAPDRLRPGQFDTRIIALAESAVAVAGQDIADLAEAHRTIRLGVAATPDVEIEHPWLIVDDLDRQRVVLRPQRQDRLEAFEVRSARGACSHLGPGVDRRAANGAAQDLARFVLADRLAHFIIDRSDDLRLDPAPSQDAEFAVAALFHEPKACAGRGAGVKFQLLTIIDLTAAVGGEGPGPSFVRPFPRIREERPMPIDRMDHFTILTTNTEETVAFYYDVLGLTPGPRPDFSFPGAWLYNGGKPVLHVVEKSVIP